MSFTYRQGLLHAEDIPLKQLAAEFDTPVFVYSQNIFLKNIRSWTHALGDYDALVCYALKANDNLELLKLAAAEGFGADVVSGGELFLARKAGIPGDQIVFAGVGKRPDEIKLGFREGIRSYNVESQQELELIRDLARESQVKAPVHLRINPDIDAQSHPYISTGLVENKFGIPIEQALDLARWAQDQSHIDFKGVHVHIGSQIKEVLPFEATSTALRTLFTTLRDVGIPIEPLDLGGGLAVDYENPLREPSGSAVPTVAQYVAAILGQIHDLPVRFVFEPGRSVVANSAVLLVRVLYTKTNGDKKFVIVDGGMNDLIRPCLYQAYHHILPVVESQAGAAETVDIVGPICESGDFFAKDRMMPVLVRNDLLAICSAGAYGYALSSNYNGRPRAAEVLVAGHDSRIIRRSETYQDLLKLYQQS